MSKIYNRLEEVFGELCDREHPPRSHDLQEQIDALFWAMNVCSLITHDSYFLDQLDRYRKKADEEDLRYNLTDEQLEELIKKKEKRK